METYGESIWEQQAVMSYDGLGERLAMTAYAEGQDVTTHYALDNGQTLKATAGDQITFYLYGLGPIAELTDSWSYSLSDGSNTPRHMTDSSGKVTLTASYTPWGDLLSIEGEGGFTWGYFGGLIDAATGLLYVGNGQYYDPQTGRFLTRNARPNQGNPYVPWQGNPSGALISPLALLALVYGRKRRKDGKFDRIIMVAILLLAVVIAVLSLAGCEKPQRPQLPPPPQPPSETVETKESTTEPSSTPETPGPPTETPTPEPTCLDIQTPSGRKEVILFGGTYNGDRTRPGPNPAIVLWPWYERTTQPLIAFPGGGDRGKADQADLVDISAYENASLILIGYSAGGDAALMFADKYWKYQMKNDGNGKITDIAVLGGTMSGEMRGEISGDYDLAIEYPRILDNLLQWGTDIYILDDKAIGGNVNYAAPPGAIGTFHFEQRFEQEHYDGATKGQVGIGTNNSETFRDEVFAWFENY